MTTPPHTTDDVLPLLAAAVDELVTAHTHREQISRHDGEKWTHTKHATDVPPLLDQLRQAVEPSSSSDSGKSSFSSRPSARLDAIDTLLRIEAASAHWLNVTCGQPLRATIADNLRALVGAAPGLDERVRWDLTREARRWATWARVTTGWEVPPFRPNNTCPLCGVRGGLRVRIGDGINSYESSGVCVECSEVWDATTIGLLAEHIIGENDTNSSPALAALVDQHYPRRGPCLMCGVEGEDARHRIVDAVAGRALAGEDEQQIADDYGLPVEAVVVAVQATVGQQLLDQAEDDTPDELSA